jgi:phage anti-repressor protein
VLIDGLKYATCNVHDLFFLHSYKQVYQHWSLLLSSRMSAYQFLGNLSWTERVKRDEFVKRLPAKTQDARSAAPSTLF